MTPTATMETRETTMAALARADERARRWLRSEGDRTTEADWRAELLGAFGAEGSVVRHALDRAEPVLADLESAIAAGREALGASGGDAARRPAPAGPPISLGDLEALEAGRAAHATGPASRAALRAAVERGAPLVPIVRAAVAAVARAALGAYRERLAERHAAEILGHQGDPGLPAVGARGRAGAGRSLGAGGPTGHGAGPQVTEGPTDLDGWATAALALLRTRGVPEPDLIPTARAGLVLVAARQPTDEARRFRAWVLAGPATAPDAPAPPTARYWRAAGQHLGVIWALWIKTRDDLGAPDPLDALWSSLDRVDGDRMLRGAMFRR